VIELLSKSLASYLLGSVVGGLVVGRLRGGIDIRKMGSGNAGGTNALRTQGKAFAFWVLLIDIGKGWMATAVIAPFPIPGLGLAPADVRVWLPGVCGIAAIAGHVYPLWHGFRGGKGVATLLGVVLGMAPGLLAAMLLTWLIAVALFGFVGLASMLAAASIPLCASFVGIDPGIPLIVFGLVVTAMILFTHRTNIARMRAGKEPRARRLWLFGRHGR
jgi:acyl phosphate:glycerol-3-phosphate acyltransferase